VDKRVGVGHQRVDGLDDVDQALGHHVGFAAHLHFGRQVARGNGLGRCRLLVGGDYAGVEVVLDDVVLALVLGGDHRRDVPLAMRST
jgi:hypothetical protein